jgi:hypothetical protein
MRGAYICCADSPAGRATPPRSCMQSALPTGFPLPTVSSPTINSNLTETTAQVCPEEDVSRPVCYHLLCPIMSPAVGDRMN